MLGFSARYLNSVATEFLPIKILNQVVEVQEYV